MNTRFRASWSRREFFCSVKAQQKDISYALHTL